MGEAPPPERFFFYGDSLFFGYLKRAFAAVSPEIDKRDAGWFLALFRALGGWRIDVCDGPRRANKGGADDVSDCLEAFQHRWRAQARDPEATVVVSPKRLVAALPPEIRNAVTVAVPPPGQWNAHRQAFLRDIAAVVEQEIGPGQLETLGRSLDPDNVRLDFEIARACAEGAERTELRRLLLGHPREAVLSRALEREQEAER